MGRRSLRTRPGKADDGAAGGAAVSLSVFVSHCCSEEDHPLVDAICEGLKANDVEPYVVERNPEPGRPIEEKLREAVKGSDAVIVLWTKGGRDSAWVNQEAGMARALGKLVIPFVEVGIKVVGVLAGIEYAALDREDPGKTVAQIRKYLARLREEAETRSAATRASPSGSENAAAVTAIAVVAIFAVVIIAVVAIWAVSKARA